MPTSVDGFNPTLQDGILPSISEMEDDLNEIFNGYESQFHDALEDPTTQRNKEMLSDVEKTTIQQFADGEINLDVQYARPLMEIVKKLQRSFARVEISRPKPSVMPCLMFFFCPLRHIEERQIISEEYCS